MDFAKNIRAGRRIAQKAARNNVLVTFQADEALRVACNKKTKNLSAFLRRCMEKLSQSNIDRKMNAMYDEIIDEVIAEQSEES